MTDDTTQPGHTARLGIRIARTAGAQGEDTTLTVFCLRRSVSVSVDACTSCGHCRGMSLDPTGRSSFLVCDWVPPERDAPKAVREHKVDANEARIADVMTRDVICVRPDLSVEALTSLFLERGISGAPVVDAKDRPIGVVSKTDLLREQFEHGDTEEVEEIRLKTEAGWDVELGPGFHAERIARATVAEIMMPIAFSLPEDASIAHAAAVMAVEGVHRVPVVSSRGEVVGILTTLDVLRWLAHGSGYLVADRESVETTDDT